MADQEQEESVDVSPPTDSDRASLDLTEDNLLDVLLYKGVLPRYAFPTDVASFFVFDVTMSSYRPAYRHSPQQGLTVALSQYAPGKEVWIANQRFLSGAIYSPFSGDRRAAWQRRRLYYECQRCGNTITRPLASGERGETLSCGGCADPHSLGPARLWFRPPGFAHPVDIDPGTSPDDSPGMSYPTRAKLEAPTPELTDARWSDVGLKVRVLYTRESLLVTNSGPKREGYNYCLACGRIEPVAVRQSKLFAAHKKPYPDPKKPDCPGVATSREICLGTDYVTDILLCQLSVEPPVELRSDVFATEIALRTLSEALSLAACRVLELEPGEVQAEFRPAVSLAGQDGRMAEIFLYDSLPGGAGFARQVGNVFKKVLEQAERVLSDCTCDTSCYRCLRSFKNRFEHSKLHRHIALELLRYIRDGIVPTVPQERITKSATLIAEDLRRQAGDALRIDLDIAVLDPSVGSVEVPLTIAKGSKQIVVCLTHSLTPGTPATDQQKELAEFSTTPVVCLHELLVEWALPHASQQLLSSLDVT